MSTLETKRAFNLLLLSSAIAVVLWFIPFGWVLEYPFRMFVTMVHEGGHALAALLTLGQVHRITVDWHGNGLTETSGGVGLVISSAGYLTATLFGALLLLLLRKADRVRPLAFGIGAALLVETVVLGGNFAIWVIGLVVGLGLLAIAWSAPKRVLHFLMSFLAVQSLLNALFDLRSLLYLSVSDTNRLTDARNMAAATGNWIPSIFWAGAWTTASLVILAFTLRIYYRGLKQPSHKLLAASTSIDRIEQELLLPPPARH